MGINNVILDSKAKIGKNWAKQLYRTVDGSSLKHSSDVMSQHRWLQEPTKFVSGSDFIHMNKVRINALPTKSRSSRGRNHDRWCRAGCSAPETLNHILQICSRTHDIRVRRHDAIVKFLKKNCSSGYEVLEEPLFRTSEGTRKPDLLFTKDHTTTVVDVQIVGEQ